MCVCLVDGKIWKAFLHYSLYFFMWQALPYTKHRIRGGHENQMHRRWILYCNYSNFMHQQRKIETVHYAIIVVLVLICL